jgi:phosphodiesterase/alkaline phosphatase D-like protein
MIRVWLVRSGFWRLETMLLQVSMVLVLFWRTVELGASPETNLLPNRVAAGDVTTNSAVLWSHAAVLGPLTFAIATDSSFTNLIFQTSTNVIDATLPVKTEVSGLTAGTTYCYRAMITGATATGTFHTPWPPGGFHGLRFGVSGDWRGELAPYPSVGNAVGSSLDFFVELGDTIYADFPSPAVPNGSATTLAEFRAKHNEVYSSRFGLNALADLRASTAIFAVPDDHEVINNFAGGAPPQSDPRFDTNGMFINETVLYRTALQAFNEYNPIRELVYDTPVDPRTNLKPKLYRAQRYGNDAVMILLDARSFRDAELPAVADPLDSTAVKAFNWTTFDLDPGTGQPLPRRTMLGAQQLADLRADLLQAKAQGALWKFVMIGEPIQNLGFADGPDRFEGYGAERADLLKFIADNQIKNVVFVSADIHGTVISSVNYQTGPDQPLLSSGSFEVVTGPVAYYKPFGPTAFDVAGTIQILPGLTLLDALLKYVAVPNRAAFDALPLSERDRLFKSIMDIQLTTIGLKPTGLDGSNIRAALTDGGYVAVHTYGWTEFEIEPVSHWLTVTTYGIAPYSPDQVNASILAPVPQIVSRFTVLPQAEPLAYPELSIVQKGTQVQLGWPTSAANFVLQSSASPFGTNWSTVTESPNQSGSEIVVDSSITATARFFRLISR